MKNIMAAINRLYDFLDCWYYPDSIEDQVKDEVQLCAQRLEEVVSYLRDCGEQEEENYDSCMEID